MMFLTVSETYINCSSNIIKTYSISGKWLIKSVSNVFNMPTIENPIIKVTSYPVTLQDDIVYIDVPTNSDIA